jgi:hypothetical protein
MSSAISSDDDEPMEEKDEKNIDDLEKLLEMRQSLLAELGGSDNEENAAVSSSANGQCDFLPDANLFGASEAVDSSVTENVIGLDDSLDQQGIS